MGAISAMGEKELGERNFGFDSEQRQEEKGIVAVWRLLEEVLPAIDTCTLRKVIREFSQKSTAEIWMISC